jgi:sugar phosphate isomerase/epimerase
VIAVPATTRLAQSISFMGANYVAREVGYAGVEEWGPCDAAANAWFCPLATYEERLEEVLAAIGAAGFDRMDMWTAHLNWRWATPEHVALAAAALDRHGLCVVSMAGNVGSTTDELAAACEVATGIGTTVLGGMGDVLRFDRDGTAAVLRAHGVRLGLENHPERTPAEVLTKIGDARDVLGVTVDTGWFATHGYDAPTAIRELGDRIFHVHLKDVERPGEHVTCPHGAGCVDIPACIEALVEIGYAGALSIEHEPWHEDPTEDCTRMLAAVREQLTKTAGGNDG